MPPNQQHDDEQPQVRVTDKRRLDPETGEPRSPGFGEGVGAPASAPAEAQDVHEAADQAQAIGEVLDEIESSGDPVALELVERTEDLRRLKAEYDNYRKRTERDRAGWGEIAVAKVIADLLPALDDIDRAKAHDALDGAFRAVADHLDKATTSAGLTSFGVVGEAFDPSRHEALTTVPGEVEAEQVLEVYRAGYEFAGRVLRAAQVVVAVPAVS